MVEKLIQLEDVVALATQLSPLDKVRLVERVAADLKADIETPSKHPLKTLEGILADLGPGPSDEDIAEVRREMLRNFPREDIEL